MLRTHGDVSASVGLAEDHRHLGYGGLAVCVEHLCSMADNAPIFLGGSWQEARHIHQCQQRDIEAVTGTDEPGSFIGGIDIHASCLFAGLIRNHANAPAMESDQPGEHVFGKMGLVFQKCPAVGQRLDDGTHVIRSAGVIWNQGVQ